MVKFLAAFTCLLLLCGTSFAVQEHVMDELMQKINVVRDLIQPRQFTSFTSLTSLTSLTSFTGGFGPTCKNPPTTGICKNINYRYLDIDLGIYGANSLLEYLETIILPLQGSFADTPACEEALYNWMCALTLVPCDGTTYLPCQSTCIDFFTKCNGFFGGATAPCSDSSAWGREDCTQLATDYPLVCAYNDFPEEDFCFGQVNWPSPQVSGSVAATTDISVIAESIILAVDAQFQSGILTGVTEPEVNVCKELIRESFCRSFVPECAEGDAYALVPPCQTVDCTVIETECPWLYTEGFLNDPVQGVDCFGFFTAFECDEEGNLVFSFASGDPHLFTLDGASYTFNGYGEYTLAKVGSEEIQVRFEPCESPSITGATCTTGLAINGGGFYAPVGSTSISVLDDAGTAITAFPATVAGGVINEITAGVEYSVTVNSLVVKFMLEEGLSSLLVEAMPALKGSVTGLVGKFNGFASDDFTTPSGEIPTTPAGNASSIYDWGNTWRVTNTSTQFHYAAAESYNTTNDFAWVPTFNVTITPQAVTACEGSEGLLSYDQCLYDVSLTGDVKFASVANSLGLIIDSYDPPYTPQKSNPVNGEAVPTSTPNFGRSDATTIPRGFTLAVALTIALLFL